MYISMLPPPTTAPKRSNHFTAESINQITANEYIDNSVKTSNPSLVLCRDLSGAPGELRALQSGVFGETKYSRQDVFLQNLVGKPSCQVVDLTEETKMDQQMSKSLVLKSSQR